MLMEPSAGSIKAADPMKKPDQIDTVLASLWQKNLPTLRERLDLIDRTASIAASGTIPEAPRLEAYNIAHKLTGSLGMFGYQQGTEIARKIEHILKDPTPKQLTTLPELAKDLRSSLASGL
jgi:HPt (histidine-containing phosphotransfer) domain-containing protein